MSEVTIAEPLSGAEVVEAILDRIRKSLHRDCYLNPNSGYESFSATIHIEVKAKDCGRVVEVKQDIPVASDNPIDEDAALEAADLTIYDQPPNQVRQDAGLGIPTLVTNSEGKQEVTKVRYARKPATEDNLLI